MRVPSLKVTRIQWGFMRENFQSQAVGMAWDGLDADAAEKGMSKAKADFQAEEETGGGRSGQSVGNGSGRVQWKWNGGENWAVIGDGDGQVGDQGLRKRTSGYEAGADMESDDSRNQELGGEMGVALTEDFETGHEGFSPGARTRQERLFRFWEMSRQEAALAYGGGLALAGYLNLHTSHRATSLPSFLPVSHADNVGLSRRPRHWPSRPFRSSSRPPNQCLGRSCNSFSTRTGCASAFPVATAFLRRVAGFRHSFSRRVSSCASRFRSRPPVTSRPSFQPCAAARASARRAEQCHASLLSRAQP